MSTKPWILVSPASRGIGLALTRYLLRRTEAPILATYRKDPEEMLKAIGQSMEGENPNMWKRLHTVRLDVTRKYALPAVVQPQLNDCFHFIPRYA